MDLSRETRQYNGSPAARKSGPDPGEGPEWLCRPRGSFHRVVARRRPKYIGAIEPTAGRPAGNGRLRLRQAMTSKQSGARIWQLTLVLWLVLRLGRSVPAAEPEIPAPLPPAEAARSMRVPDGFRVTLFAAEPDVKQPIAMCFDDRGRLWVAEAYNYPEHGLTPGDRILILEDTDSDGTFNRRTVFFEQLNYVTGIEVGFGGVWVMSPPYFLFIPDQDGDDRPDGAAQVLLDGFGNHANAHNLANGFAWGPDGWLYGTHGRTNWSLLGKPGTPEHERIRFDGGVYRYHPVRHVWEPYADGTTNPWGIDWNDYGEAFVCNCVTPHLYHVIQGAHYEPWRNRQSSQFAYQRIATIADHLHFVGDPRDVRSGLGSAAEDEAGGGHAHCGTLIYLGDSWPQQYRNTVLMHNIHGHRINNDRLRRQGSGYVASHGEDILVSRDLWYMGVTLLLGPDGSVYSSDWSDTGECHSVVNTRRETGRIFKIAYGQPAWVPINLAQLDNQQLVNLQLHANDWHVRHARRILQERAARGDDMSAVCASLQELFLAEQDVPRRLRLLWALHVVGGLGDERLVKLLHDDSEYVRAWAVRLLCENKAPAPAARDRFLAMCQSDESSLVRLHLASSLQRLALDQRWPLVAALASHQEDASDANLPRMIWYGAQPLIQNDLERFVHLLRDCRLPLVRQNIARRAAMFVDTSGRSGLHLLIESIQGATADAQRDLLAGLLVGLKGVRTMAAPAPWRELYPQVRDSADLAVREQALELALLFDDPRAVELLQTHAVNRQLGAPARQRAIRALVARQLPGFADTLRSLVSDPTVRTAALRGLAEYDDPQTANVILGHYEQFDRAARHEALQVLASRVAWAKALLDAVEANRVPREDLTAYTARQLNSLGDPEIARRVDMTWGDVRESPAEKRQQIVQVKRALTTARLEAANRSAGRRVFGTACGNCHRLFGEGAEIGPDLTGAQRGNLDYLLENIIDPSATVSSDYRMEVVETVSGRVITGLVEEETANAITIQTVTERVVVPANEILERTRSTVSMMPDGLLQTLTPEQVLDLVAYVTGKSQVPLPGDEHP
jgi:putative membrane-bound dehydrogenase-like protein